MSKRKGVRGERRRTEWPIYGLDATGSSTAAVLAEEVGAGVLAE